MCNIYINWPTRNITNLSKLYVKRDDFNFPIGNFPFICSNIPAAPVYGVYISRLIWYSTVCGSYRDFLDRGLVLGSYRTKGSSWLSWSHHLESFRSLPWLGWPLWHIWVTNDHGYVPFVVYTSRSFPHSWLITGFITRPTGQVSLVEQELFTLPEHLSSLPNFSGVRVTRSLVLYVKTTRTILNKFKPQNAVYLTGDIHI